MLLPQKTMPPPRSITQCPVCDAALRVTELSCVRCDTRLQGAFAAPPLAQLPEEHQRFVATFVLCRGVIRDVERALGVSYPTVRARLDAAVQALERLITEPLPASPRGEPSFTARRRALLQQVEDGVLDPAEAADALRRL